MKRHLLLATMVTSSLLLGACSGTGSSSMDAGQRISQRGDEIGNYGAAWSDGQRDVTEGRQLVEKNTDSSADAEKRLAQARADMAKAEEQLRKAQLGRSDGERLIADGTAQMQQAEADYTAVRAGPPAIGAVPAD